MKILKFAFVILVMVIGLSSCQKDDEPKDNSQSVEGTWEGHWGFNTETPSVFEKWEMGELSTLNAYLGDGTWRAVGSWDQEGNEIEVHYTALASNYRYTYIGTYDEVAGKITGHWNDDDFLIGGTFEMERQ